LQIQSRSLGWLQCGNAAMLLDRLSPSTDTSGMSREVKPSSDADERFHGFLAIQGRGTVALPPRLRKRYHLDRPGAQVELTEREDGVLELRPSVAVPASETWFWDERWQAGEREVDAHLEAGQTATHESVEDFRAHLDALDAE
jgi:hypothetical protein